MNLPIESEGMQPSIHFYDAQYIGTPTHGQLVAFDSMLCTAEGLVRYDTRIRLRPDVMFNPLSVEKTDCFDLDIAEGVTEYEWSRKAQLIFERPGTLHVGLGNTSAVDHFIRFAMYRCLSTLPNTELSTGAHFLDLLTICRAINVLRPESMPVSIDSDWTEQRKRDCVMAHDQAASRAENVISLTTKISESCPKLLAHAIAHSSPDQIGVLCGLAGGQLESLAPLRPVFICHEHLLTAQKFGIFLALGTDPQYSNIVYMVDLQSDLAELVDDNGASVSRFIRTDASQTDRPVLRVNLNRVPFVCPLGVVDPTTAKRLAIDIGQVKHNAAVLKAHPELCLALMEVSGAAEATMTGDADGQLYGSEYLEPDRALLNRFHSAAPADWELILNGAHDARITALGMRLFRRCSPALLDKGESRLWRAHCATRLLSRTDPTSIQVIKDYCTSVSDKPAYPKGIQAAARHWLHTIEIGNDPKTNF